MIWICDHRLNSELDLKINIFILSWTMVKIKDSDIPDLTQSNISANVIHTCNIMLDRIIKYFVE